MDDIENTDDGLSTVSVNSHHPIVIGDRGSLEGFPTGKARQLSNFPQRCAFTCGFFCLASGVMLTALATMMPTTLPVTPQSVSSDLMESMAEGGVTTPLGSTPPYHDIPPTPQSSPLSLDPSQPMPLTSARCDAMLRDPSHLFRRVRLRDLSYPCPQLLSR
jgi:hypothetical protein